MCFVIYTNCNVSSRVADPVPFSLEFRILEFRIRILLKYMSLYKDEPKIMAFPYLILTMTLKIKYQKVILQKLYFRQYFITKKLQLQGVCLWTNKEPEPGG